MAYPNWDEQTMRKRTHWRLLALGGLAAAGLTDVPPHLDIFVTGLVLGTSSLPAHAAITNVGELIGRIGGAVEEKKKS